MNATTMATTQVPGSVSSAPCEVAAKLPENVVANATQQPGPRVLPLLYIQGTPTVRVSAASTAVTTSNGSSAQVLSGGTRPTSTHQFIPTLAPKLTVAPVGSSGLTSVTTVAGNKAGPVGAQQHFVIQAPRAGTGASGTSLVPVTVGQGKHAFAYLGTIIKPGVGVSKTVDATQLVLPTGQIATSLVPAGNQKLLLAPVPVLPQLSANVAPTSNVVTTQQPKVTSLLVPMTLPTQVGNKGGLINLKISNGQIHTDNKKAVTVLREPKPLAPNIGQVPPLHPLSKVQIQKPSGVTTNGLLLPDSTTLTPVKETQQPLPPPAVKKPVIEEESVVTKSVNNNNNTVTSNMNNSNTDETMISKELVFLEKSEEMKKMNQDLNRCLQEVVDAFSPKSPPPLKEETVDAADDEVTLIKVIPSKEEDAKRDTVIKAELPEDDVKIELVKPEANNSTLEHLNENSDDFDPMKVLDWKDGIGALPGSNLKFRMNEFGLMEMVEEDDYEKIMSSKGSVTSEGSELAKDDVEQADEKNEKPKTVKEEDEEQEEEPERSKYKSAHAKCKDSNRPAGTSDDIFCCEGCGCYGLASEFINSSFCSDSCAASYASKMAARNKREKDLHQLRMRRRKKRMHLIQLQNLVDVSPHPPSSTQPPPVKTPSLSEDDTASNDGMQESSKPRRPWQIGKNGFSWAKYLEHCKAKKAPLKLFKDPFPYTKNRFKTGMKMEGIDPEHPSLYCVLTVSDVQGYRIRLHFDGYPENYDFWANADSVDIFPAGWCEKTNHRLQPPPGYTIGTFNWGNYLKQAHSQAAPRNIFNKTGHSVCPHGFRLGMKLEAVERKSSSQVCVATVADLRDNHILVHFDGRDNALDYWADPTSPYIHPVGWCEEQGRTLTSPRDYSSLQPFSWETYLQETKATSVPPRAFKQRQPTGFQRGMRLECVDRRVPSLVRVATIDAVRGHQIRVRFDGWSEVYSYWLDDDSPDIHPVGWCQKTGHPLEPPLTPEDMNEQQDCPTPGCRGVGHVKGAKYDTHQTAISCPYSAQNLNKERLKPDRLATTHRLTEEFRETKAQSPVCDKRPAEGKNPVGRPPKWRRPEPETEEDDERRRKKKRRSSEEAPEEEQVRTELRQAILTPGYTSAPSLAPPLWAKHSRYLNNWVTTINNPLSWSEREVGRFVSSIPGCERASPVFCHQKVDGEALLLMTQDDLVQHIGLKLGPAIKLYNSIVLLRQKVLAR